MKISGQGNFFGPERNSGTPGANGSKPVSSTGATSSDSSLSGAAGREATSDLTRLQQQLRAIPETRQDRVETVKALVSEGHYDTRAAAEATADAILSGARS